MRPFIWMTCIVVATLAAGLACAGTGTASGYVATAVWGEAGESPGELASPKSAAVDAAGRVYVVDYLNHTLLKYEAGGALLDVWGGYGSEPGRFFNPSRVAVGPDGSVYVTDAGNHRVQRFTGSGLLLGCWGREGRGRGEFRYPRGVAVAANGTVYVTDERNHRVQAFTADGRFLRSWGSRGSGRGRFGFAKDVAVGRHGRVYVVERDNARVQVFSAAGRWLDSWGRGGAAPGRFRGARGLGIDARGHVFVADSMNYRIQEFTAAGVFVRQWGCRGSLPGLLMQPRDVAPAPDGTLVVADTVNDRLQRYAPSPLSDSEPPRTTSSVTARWSRTPVTATLSAGDAESGVAVTYARRGAVGAFEPYAAPFALTTEGAHRLQYLSVDAAGNQEITRTQVVRLDWTSPAVRPVALGVTRTTLGRAATLRFSVADRYSPRCRLTLVVTRDGRPRHRRDLGWRRASRDGRAQEVAVGARLARGRYGVTVTARDAAGNLTAASGVLVVR